MRIASLEIKVAKPFLCGVRTEAERLRLQKSNAGEAAPILNEWPVLRIASHAGHYQAKEQ